MSHSISTAHLEADMLHIKIKNMLNKLNTNFDLKMFSLHYPRIAKFEVEFQLQTSNLAILG